VANNYHQGSNLPSPTQKGSRAALMGQNMTQRGTKNSLKQPKTTKLAFGSFHQYGKPAYHKMNFHIVFWSFFQSPKPASFSFSHLQPTFQKNPHLTGGIPHKDEFKKKSAQLRISV
jgi:hypothetical protein